MLIHGDGFFNGQNFVETRKPNGTFTYDWERSDDNVSVIYPFNCVYKRGNIETDQSSVRHQQQTWTGRRRSSKTCQDKKGQDKFNQTKGEHT